MRIQSVRNYTFNRGYNNNNQIKNNKTQKKSPCSFKGTPWEAPYNFLYTTWENYKPFALGNYLDMHDDIFAPQNKQLRKSNLRFLDEASEKDKKYFVEEYCKLTGYPDLKKVSKGIEEEFKRAALALRDKMTGWYSSVDAKHVALVGYDPTCSVGRGMANPASDLDKCFVLLIGTDDDEENERAVNDCKGALWRETDQRILSYNHGVSSVPIVYTLKQVRDMARTIDDKLELYSSDKEQLEKLFNTFDPEYQNSALYSEWVADKFPARHGRHPKYLNPQNPTKNDIKNMSFFIEIMREGKILYENENDDVQRYINDIKKTNFYKYSNLCQTHYIKQASKPRTEKVVHHGLFKDKVSYVTHEPEFKPKNKLLKRQEVAEKFDSMSLDEKYKLIKSFIYASCDDKEEGNNIFTNDFDMSVKLEPVFNYLTTGDRDLKCFLQFKQDGDKWTAKYRENPSKSVDLYLGNYGHDKKTLWVDTDSREALEQILAHFNDIKQIPTFREIEAVEAPCWVPDAYYDYVRTRKSFLGEDIYRYKFLNY